MGWSSAGLLGLVVLGLGQSLPVWIAGTLLFGIPGAVINGSNQAIWQSKVAPDVQGRVFATRRLIAWLVTPMSQLVAGPLADQVMEPAMAVNGSLSPIFGGIVGTGPGAGIGLMFVVTGIFATFTGLSGYLFPAIRDVETLLPDHEAVMVEG